MTSQIKIVQVKRSRRRWAAYGFLLIVALLIISWFSAQPVIDLLKSVFKQFGPALRTITPIQQQIAFTLIIFVILAIFAALLVTLGAPKRPLNVKEKDLIKERNDAVKYHKMDRKRQRRLNREMREYVEKKNQK